MTDGWPGLCRSADLEEFSDSITERLDLQLLNLSFKAAKGF